MDKKGQSIINDRNKLQKEIEMNRAKAKQFDRAEILEEEYKEFMKIAKRSARRNALFDIKFLMQFHNYNSSCIQVIKDYIEKELAK